MTWIDLTSYQRGGDERTPTTWGLAVPKGSHLRVVVTCAHIYHRPNWCVRVGPFDHDPVACEGTTLEAAKQEAVARARKLVLRLAADLAEATT